MAVDRVKFQEIVASQLPRYVREDFPLLGEFLEQYYISQESQSGPVDIINNIDQYVKVEELFDIVDNTSLTSDISFTTKEIPVSSTIGFPDANGIIQIDDEVIYYTGITSTSFTGCKRGFSGITTYVSTGNPDELTFSQTETNKHTTSTKVKNLNVLFLKQFLNKLKKQVTPGYDDRNFYEDLNKKNFIYNSKSFYSSKGTDQSFEILFRALYGEDVEILKPSEFLLTPSNADYKITQDYVVEKLSGDPLDLKNLTIFQRRTGARGSVTNVQQIPYADYQFYQVSIDSGNDNTSVTGSIFGEFKPNPLTKLLENVSIGASIISVDSTVDFPEFGNLAIVDEDGRELSIAYTGKTSNQFYNCSGIINELEKTVDVKFDDYSYAYVGINTDTEIQVRFTSTLKDFVQNDKTNYFRPLDTIQIKSLGYEAPGKKSNNWFLNVKPKYKVGETTVIDATAFIYQFKFLETHFFSEGYELRYENEDKTVSLLGTVVRVISNDTVNVRFSAQIPLTGTFFVENQLLKGDSTKYPYLEEFVANVQNTYAKFNGDVMVASNSIPKFDDILTNTYNCSVTFSASLKSTKILDLPTNPTSLPDHGFHTGDSVYFQSAGTGFENIPSASYFVKRIDESKISLARSKADLFRNTFVTFNGSVTNASLTLLEFYKKNIEPQGIYRQILEPTNNRVDNQITKAGTTGIWNNGVELLNYKSTNSVYYGDILGFTVTRGGQDYDVINPPVVNISDEVGTGATGVANVLGNLVRLDVTDGGMGYYAPPTITITGGNGFGAAAEPRMISIIHENPFIADSSNVISLANNEITFRSDHKFLDGESVIYETRGTKGIAGLTTESEYFVFVSGQKTLKLHTTRADAIAGVNTVGFTQFGNGVQYLRASKLKSIVSSVVITNPGEGYENKQRVIPTVGVNTVSNRVEIQNHGYRDGEVVRYTRDSSLPSVQGLYENRDYYVIKVNEDEFSLTEVGSGTQGKSYFYDRKITVNFVNAGRGSFNYPPITVDVEGAASSFDKTFVEDFQELYVIESPITENIITPVSVLAWTDTEAEIHNPYYVLVSENANWLISDDPFIGNILLYEAKLQPVFRGSIQSIDRVSGGVGYGASTIIDFNRQPEITFKSGEGAVLTPIINNGKITEVVVNSPGNGYNSPPDLVVRSLDNKGDYAILVPIIENGQIKSVTIQKTGLGYTPGKTSIDVIASGRGSRVQTNVRAWNVNLFEKTFENIGDDDCVLTENIANTSLQFASFYAPRPLRAGSNSVNGFEEDNIKYGLFDLQLTTGGEETSSGFHSPILGWAYDGNPIYGPYAYDKINGSGNIRRMKSGYKLKNTPVNRPSYTAFQNGFFVDDYEFVGDGDLDEYNGRFCVTPDYPNGVYAYFCTISDNIESTGPFNSYRLPQFPYVIGDKYRSLPVDFNFKATSNQTDYNITKNNWFRNTRFYFTNGGNNGYDYIFNSDLIRNSSIDITSTTLGGIDILNIKDPGHNYKVNDKIIFDSSQTSGRGVNWRVSEIKGKDIEQVSLATTVFDASEIIGDNSANSFLGITSSPHGFLTNDIVFVDGLSQFYRGLGGAYRVGVTSERWYTSVGIATGTTTGIVTYVYLNGIIDPSVVRPNDILRIDSEQFKVLNLDAVSGRIRVLRGHNNTLQVTHSADTLVRDDPRKVRFTTTGISTNKPVTTNRTHYFMPNESVGLGTATTGTATTITFSNPGVGVTQIRLQQQQFFYPDHGFELNTPLKYYTNGGTSLAVWSGIQSSTIFNLEETRDLFAVPLTRDIIGLASDRVALSTVTSQYVGVDSSKGGLLYFTNSTGLGVTHSLVTVLPQVLTGRISQNVVTVSTGETHGMKRGDRISVDVNPTTTSTIKVFYDDYNRRIVFDKDTIEPSGINTSGNMITVPSNKYRTGDKIIYTSGDPSEGLIASGMYYVFVYKRNIIKLVMDKFELFTENPSFVNVGSATTGTIARINPRIEVQKNQNLKFDLSDPSLSFVDKGITYSAFEMHIYSDSQKINEFFTTKTDSTFEVTTEGNIGIDSTANLTLNVSDNIPRILYYGFEPDNLDIIPPVKLRIFEDDTVFENNSIGIVPNKFDGVYSVVGVTSDTYDYNIPFDSDTITSYGSTSATMKYHTSSLTAQGPIHTVNAINKGLGYKTLPGFTSVRSTTGTGALLEPRSTTIGSILKQKMNYIGFGFPSDNTLNAVGSLPQVLRVDPLGSFESIGISSGGVNYSQPPQLVVLDGVTGKQITDLDLRFGNDDNFITIVQNTQSLNDVEPQIIPLQNTNGFSISSITYNNSTKIVRLSFSKQFSDAQDWPFKVGEEILVENVAVGFGTTGTGYNSEDYGFKLFKVTSLDSNLGGSGSYIEYDLTDVLATGEAPGNITSVVSGSVTPKTFFPIFDPVIKVAPLLTGEKVDNEGRSGIVERFDNVSRYLFVSSEENFLPGTDIVSESSGVKASIIETIPFNSTIKLGVGATFIDGWQTNSGFLNDNLQVIPNNEYYQNFSYSLKSRIDLETWEDAVSSLNHTAGFQKFADLVIDNNAPGIVTAADIEISTVVDLIGEGMLNCFPDFDGATERTLDISEGRTISNEIVFENKVLVDYFESRGNRVLKIDDFSGDFDSEPRDTPYSIISFFDNKYAWNKFFTLIQDTEIRNRKQFGIVTLLQNGSEGYLNQYGTLDTGKALGSFDYISIGTSQFGLQWYPNLFEFNNYEISYFNFAGLESVTGIGSTAIGSMVSVASSSVSVAAGTTTRILEIPTATRSAKLHIQMEDGNDNYFYNELNVLHDGTNVQLLQYGDVDTTGGPSSGFGTYTANISGSNIEIDIHPIVGTAVSTNILSVEVHGTNTGVDTTGMIVTNLSSYHTGISSSATPSANEIASYNDPFAAEYFMVTVHDTTNDEYEMFECHVLDSNNNNITKYGQIDTISGVGLGTVGMTKTGSAVSLNFTPNANIAVDVKIFGIGLKNFNNITGITSISDLQNNILFSNHGTYTGTEFDTKRAFNLKHNGLPIFQRAFLGNNSSIVNLTNNSINIPDHFFVTGEKLVYSYENSLVESTNAIGIVTQSIAGVSTDKLPTEVFAVKLSNSAVGLATNAAAALAATPDTIDLLTLGIGTFHKFTSTNQNARALMAIDNMIQAPVTEVVISTTLDQELIFDVDFEVTGITSFRSNDLIKIDDEIMLIQNIGVGQTNNFKVLRAQMGTGVATHANGSTVQRLGGNYNIVENTVHFASAPFGGIPIGTDTAGPDNVDWSGITTHSTFQGRTFMRSGIEDDTTSTYSSNFTFDNIQKDFNGQTKNFSLLQSGSNVIGFSTNQAIILNSNILQEPQGAQATTGDFTLGETAGVTSITYLGESVSSEDDPNRATIPRGGSIISVASTPGFGFQPLISAGASCFVSGGGTITSIEIGNPGSGYRVGVQTVQVGIITTNVGFSTVVNIGTATVQDGEIVAITTSFFGSNLDQNNPPLVVIDAPLPYSNIPLVYADGTTGLGTGAKVDVRVGQGSSVIEFEIVSGGFGYGESEELRLSIGGTTGIQTTSSASFDQFILTVTETYRDTFNGFTIGELDVFDKLDDQFDGVTKRFPLAIAGNLFAIETAVGSDINIAQCLIVTINDILQVPNSSYKFNGGSIIEFTEPPKVGDTSKIIFYKGTPGVDVVLVDILETVKIGDSLQLKNDSGKGQTIGLLQEERIVTGITTLDTVTTFAYDGPGITTNQTLVRPLTWCKQIDDITINGDFVTKDRVEYEPSIYPAAYLTQYVGVNTVNAYVDTVRPFFNSKNETSLLDYNDRVTIVDQSPIVGAIATVTVSAGGSVTGFTISNVGSGYSGSADVSISQPIDIVGGTRATATANISGGGVTSFTITNAGVGYSASNPPQILVEVPEARREVVGVNSYFGDQGIIVGYAQTTLTSGTLELYIPQDSFMRDTNIVGTAVTLSQVQAGDLFVVNLSNFGLSTTNSDGIYTATKAYDFVTDLTSVGLGTTAIRRVEVNTVGFGTTTAGFIRGKNFGEYTWGRIQFKNRVAGNALTFTPNGYSGLTTSPLIQRFRPLKFNNYLT